MRVLLLTLLAPYPKLPVSDSFSDYFSTSFMLKMNLSSDGVLAFVSDVENYQNYGILITGIFEFYGRKLDNDGRTQVHQ